MKKLGILVLFAFVMAVTPAVADAANIAVIDLQKALNLTDMGKDAKNKITEKAKEFEGKIEEQQNELKALQEDLEKQAVLLSDDARAAKEREYQQKLKDFQRYAKDRQEELQQLDGQFTNQIVEKLLDLAQELAKQEGVDVLLERGSGGVVYAADSVDLTDKLIAAADAVKE